MKHTQIKKGFTLVEVLLYMALVSMVMIVVTSFFGVIIETDSRGQATQEVDQTGLHASEYISLLLRNATNITSPATAGDVLTTITFDSTIATSNPVVIDLSGGKIRVTQGADAPIELNNDEVIASGLSFKNLTPTDSKLGIKFQFSLNYNNPDNKQALNYAQTFYGSATTRK